MKGTELGDGVVDRQMEDSLLYNVVFYFTCGLSQNCISKPVRSTELLSVCCLNTPISPFCDTPVYKGRKSVLTRIKIINYSSTLTPELCFLI